VLPRWALTFWPDLRRQVTDVVSIAATQHGTTGGPLGSAYIDSACRPTVGCPPAIWQQRIGSRFLSELNARDETPGRTSWTTVRILNDGIVQPQQPPRPTSSLRGARNLLVEAVCPGRATGPFAAPYDSVSFASLLDAIEHRGGARASRFPKGVCDRPYGSGLDPPRTTQRIDATLGLFLERVVTSGLKAKAEPALRRYARIRR